MQAVACRGLAVVLGDGKVRQAGLAPAISKWADKDRQYI